MGCNCSSRCVSSSSSSSFSGESEAAVHVPVRPNPYRKVLLACIASDFGLIIDDQLQRMAASVVNSAIPILIHGHALEPILYGHGYSYGHGHSRRNSKTKTNQCLMRPHSSVTPTMMDRNSHTNGGTVVNQHPTPSSENHVNVTVNNVTINGNINVNSNNNNSNNNNMNALEVLASICLCLLTLTTSNHSNGVSSSKLEYNAESAHTLVVLASQNRVMKEAIIRLLEYRRQQSSSCVHTIIWSLRSTNYSEGTEKSNNHNNTHNNNDDDFYLNLDKVVRDPCSSEENHHKQCLLDWFHYDKHSGTWWSEIGRTFSFDDNHSSSFVSSKSTMTMKSQSQSQSQSQHQKSPSRSLVENSLSKKLSYHNASLSLFAHMNMGLLIAATKREMTQSPSSSIVAPSFFSTKEETINQRNPNTNPTIAVQFQVQLKFDNKTKRTVASLPSAFHTAFLDNANVNVNVNATTTSTTNTTKEINDPLTLSTTSTSTSSTAQPGSIVTLVGRSAFPCVCEVSKSQEHLFQNITSSVVSHGIRWQTLYLVIVGGYMILAEPEKSSGGNGRILCSCLLSSLTVEQDKVPIHNSSPARRLVLTHASIGDEDRPSIFTYTSTSTSTTSKTTSRSAVTTTFSKKSTSTSTTNHNNHGVVVRRSKLSIWFEDGSAANTAYQALHAKVSNARVQRGKKFQAALSLLDLQQQPQTHVQPKQ